MVEIFAIKLNRNMHKNEYEKLLEMVNEEKRQRIQRFRRYKDSQICLLADIIMKKIIRDKHAINDGKVAFLQGSHGKPKLKEPYENIHFNYAHSGDWIVCAIDDAPVGIDTEQIKEIDMTIAKKFFSQMEYEALMKLSGENQLAYFYNLWTLKESYMKWDGRGLSIPLNSFSFVVKDDGSVYFQSETENRSCFFKQYFIDDAYKLSVCTSNKTFCKDVIIIKFDEIIGQLMR